MIDWFLDNVPDNVTVPSLAVGNKVDILLDGDDAWDDYTAFFQQAVAHLHANHAGIKIGVKTTVMHGLLQGDLSRIQQINQHSDAVMLTYYPQDAGFGVLEPAAVHDHFAGFATDFAGRDIWIMELGYQSGSLHCNSSQEKQARFYREMFRAWDAHRDAIQVVIAEWLHDQAPQMIAEWEIYYGSSDPAFVEYLSTLGLRNHDHTDKLAWPAVLDELQLRGWTQ
jgi:hypothetical protein